MKAFHDHTRTAPSTLRGRTTMLVGAAVAVPSLRTDTTPPAHRRLYLLALLILSLWTYAGVASCDFVSLDDPMAVVDNPHIADGLTVKGIAWAWTTSYYDYWHPLSWMSHMVDVSLYGMNPRGHHVTNLLLHLLCVVLVFLFVARLTADGVVAAVSAGLFAVHPVHTESVAWIVERKDLLACALWYGTLISYLWYSRAPSLHRFLVVLPLFALGLAAKPMAVTLPFVMLVLDILVLGRLGAPSRGAGISRKAVVGLVLEKVPFLIASTASAAATLAVTRNSAGLYALDSVGLCTRLSTTSISYFSYLRSIFWPANLSVYYPYDFSVSAFHGLLAGAGVAALLTVALLVRRRAPLVALGAVWYLSTLLPVIGLVQTGSQARADRFLYIPALGVYLAIAHVFRGFRGRALRYRWMPSSLLAGVLVLLALLTRVQVQYWQNTETLFRHALRVTEDNWFAEHNLGVFLLNNGRVDEALPLLQSSTQTAPGHRAGWYHLGLALARSGDLRQARCALDRAIALDSSRTDAVEAKANVLYRLGDFRQAEELYRIVAAARKTDWVSRNNLGLALAAQGRAEEARVCFQQAVTASGGRPEPVCNLAMHVYRTGSSIEAAPLLDSALVLCPANREVRFARALTYWQLGRIDVACAGVSGALWHKGDGHPQWPGVDSLLLRCREK